MVLLSALACGAILSLFASLPAFFRKSRLIAQQQKTIAKLERTAGEQQPLPVNHEAS